MEQRSSQRTYVPKQCIGLFRWWNCRNAYLDLPHFIHLVILYFPHGKPLNIIPWKFRGVVFSVRRLLWENFKPWWFGLPLQNQIGVEILKHRDQGTHFCSFTIELKFFQDLSEDRFVLVDDSRLGFSIRIMKSISSLRQFLFEKLAEN